TISARDIYRFGPHFILNDPKGAIALANRLAENGWLEPITSWRRDRKEWRGARGPKKKQGETPADEEIRLLKMSADAKTHFFYPAISLAAASLHPASASGVGRQHPSPQTAPDRCGAEMRAISVFLSVFSAEMRAVWGFAWGNVRVHRK